MTSLLPQSPPVLPQFTAEGVRFHSRWGGFWTDLNIAEQLLEGRLRTGSISNEDAERLRSWIRDGYVILPKAASAGDCDAALADIDRIYEGSLGKAYVERWEEGRLLVKPVRPEHRRMKAKLLDTYTLSEPMRRIVFNPAVARFLALVFEQPVMAFHSLYFETGSEQPIHQDTAYVRVQSPTLFAGAWVALEDIAEGSGELEYFPGSQRFPDYPFLEGSKWMVDQQKEGATYLQWLKDAAAERGIPRERFRPKKGDALIWAADFAHGGGKIQDPSLTRRSNVTHYCPVSVKPHYFFRGPGKYAGPVEWAPNLFYSNPIHG